MVFGVKELTGVVAEAGLDGPADAVAVVFRVPALAKELLVPTLTDAALTTPFGLLLTAAAAAAAAELGLGVGLGLTTLGRVTVLALGFAVMVGVGMGEGDGVWTGDGLAVSTGVGMPVGGAGDGDADADGCWTCSCVVATSAGGAWLTAPDWMTGLCMGVTTTGCPCGVTATSFCCTACPPTALTGTDALGCCCRMMMVLAEVPCCCGVWATSTVWGWPWIRAVWGWAITKCCPPTEPDASWI